MHGTLLDLFDQTLHLNDSLEIIVIDSGSTENEYEIVQSFLNKFNNLKYLKTNHRESLYSAWNRGIQLSSGKYITNSNTDDRHNNNCLELLVNHLENNQEIDIVYGSLYKSLVSNETYRENDLSIPCESQSFSLVLYSFIISLVHNLF